MREADTGATLTIAEWDALWQDPAHWDRLGSYRCAADPRLLVRGRGGMGWTVNMGHRRAQGLLWGILGVVVAFVVAIAAFVARAT